MALRTNDKDCLVKWWALFTPLMLNSAHYPLSMRRRPGKRVRVRGRDRVRVRAIGRVRDRVRVRVRFRFKVKVRGR